MIFSTCVHVKHTLPNWSTTVQEISVSDWICDRTPGLKPVNRVNIYWHLQQYAKLRSIEKLIMSQVLQQQREEAAFLWFSVSTRKNIWEVFSTFLDASETLLCHIIGISWQVFKHHHEEATGRTSSIGQHTLCLDSLGTILNDTQFRWGQQQRVSLLLNAKESLL